MIFEQVQFSNLLALRLLLSSHSVAAVALLANSGAAKRHSHCTIVGCRNAAALLPAITTREIPRQVIDLLCLASAHAAAGCRNCAAAPPPQRTALRISFTHFDKHHLLLSLVVESMYLPPFYALHCRSLHADD